MINLVDLAGSEKINKSEDISDDHFKELKNINQSLTTLGNIYYLGKVIHYLTLKSNKLPIPYRDSKLT